MGKFQVEITSVKQKVLGVEKQVGAVEGSLKTLEEEVDVIGRRFDNLESTVENLDNAQRRNNLKIHRLKEAIEGKDLSGYLIDSFTSWVASDCEVELSISSTYRVGLYRVTNKYPRDIIVKVSYWKVKAKVLETLRLFNWSEF